ncbi:hypothetical protein ACFQS6_20430 [Xanthomonas populi]|uniref:Polyketide cyclase n=1 Tax=Xanthomonas populi TaxID=53414 RepID=A0A2S7EN22_9XANT|nr:hypothetical protein [Xanthomonas populi]PPU92528.1 hypothetical protein XpopCFBP1817_12090 [Xanthomonas populi]
MPALPINPFTSNEDGTRVVRSMRMRAEPHEILDAWCDATVQQRILQGAAALVSGDGHASRWKLHAPLQQDLPVQLRRGDARLGESVRYHAESDHGLQLDILLHVQPLRGREGSEVTLTLQYAVEGMVAQVLTELVNPAPYVLSGKGLRRLRACLDVSEIPILLPSSSVRRFVQSHL